MMRYFDISNHLQSGKFSKFGISCDNAHAYCNAVGDSDACTTIVTSEDKISSPTVRKTPVQYGTSAAGIFINRPSQDGPSYTSLLEKCKPAAPSTPCDKLPLTTEVGPVDMSNSETEKFDIFRIAPEDFANQLTILDYSIFVNIHPDELSSCAWNKKNKQLIAPNVVAFSRRFNHVCFWCVQEILSGNTIKQRTEIVAFIIKIAKKLYDLNNLHSLFAIISALQSAPIYRLAKTWANIPKKDKQTFDKLSEVFSDANNWSNLRTHIDSLKLPCIPYLGLYLTDLVYIDVAHPHTGGLESQQRTLKMNNILRVISNYQQSNDYLKLEKLPYILEYFNSIRYIEELQRFIEDDQYKLSLRLEPPTPPASSSASCSSKESVLIIDACAAAAIASLNLSPAKASSGSLRLHAATVANNKFQQGHRKCRSLGTNVFNKTHPISYNTVQPELLHTSNGLHLLDDSELEESCRNVAQSQHTDMTCDHLPSDSVHNTEDHCTLIERQEHCLITDDQVCAMQGCVMRKTLLKEGRKPTVSSWQKYWLQLWTTSSLVYFAPKFLRGCQRSDFKREPCKLMCLVGCQVIFDNTRGDTFQLLDSQHDNMYKFRVHNRNIAERWCKSLQQWSSAQNHTERMALPSNLMTFE